MSASLGLVEVPLERLKLLLRAVHRGELSLPLQTAEMVCIGLQQYIEPLQVHLRGLDERAVRAVLVAVIAERTRGSAG